MHLTDHARRKWAVPSEEEDRHVKGAIIYYIIVILGMLKEYTYTVLRVYIYIYQIIVEWDWESKIKTLHQHLNNKLLCEPCVSNLFVEKN